MILRPRNALFIDSGPQIELPLPYQKRDKRSEEAAEVESEPHSRWWAVADMMTFENGRNSQFTLSITIQYLCLFSWIHSLFPWPTFFGVCRLRNWAHWSGLWSDRQIFGFDRPCFIQVTTLKCQTSAFNPHFPLNKVRLFPFFTFLF